VIGNHEDMSSIAPSTRSWRLARATAPLARRLAGRRGFPLWAVIHHRGRVSGRELTVPVAVRTTPEVFVIALPWGSGTNWVRNVLAAGGCVVHWKGHDHVVTRPVIADVDDVRPYYGPVTGAVARRLLKPGGYLVLRR
jgi:deazaflavin-dependent oxidoreductase (nitroreductase family)